MRSYPRDCCAEARAVSGSTHLSLDAPTQPLRERERGTIAQVDSLARRVNPVPSPTCRDAAGLLCREGSPSPAPMGATSPATKRERRIIGCAERYILTGARYYTQGRPFPQTLERNGVFDISRFPITGCRGHPCRRKRETHGGFHIQSNDFFYDAAALVVPSRLSRRNARSSGSTRLPRSCDACGK
jgi:hypothetical protein